jgi:hypothetical protein
MVCGVADTGSCWVVEAGRLLMTDDIVTRLRNWHDQRDSWQTLTEAADEIERLREQVRQLEVERDQWQTQAVRGG